MSLPTPTIVGASTARTSSPLPAIRRLCDDVLHCIFAYLLLRDIATIVVLVDRQWRHAAEAQRSISECRQLHADESYSPDADGYDRMIKSHGKSHLWLYQLMVSPLRHHIAALTLRSTLMFDIGHAEFSATMQPFASSFPHLTSLHLEQFDVAVITSSEMTVFPPALTSLRLNLFCHGTAAYPHERELEPHRFCALLHAVRHLRSLTSLDIECYTLDDEDQFMHHFYESMGFMQSPLRSIRWRCLSRLVAPRRRDHFAYIWKMKSLTSLDIFADEDEEKQLICWTWVAFKRSTLSHQLTHIDIPNYCEIEPSWFSTILVRYSSLTQLKLINICRGREVPDGLISHVNFPHMRDLHIEFRDQYSLCCSCLSPRSSAAFIVGRFPTLTSLSLKDQFIDDDELTSMLLNMPSLIVANLHVLDSTSWRLCNRASLTSIRHSTENVEDA